MDATAARHLLTAWEGIATRQVETDEGLRPAPPIRLDRQALLSLIELARLGVERIEQWENP
jgi:hypothetical protein